jgi:inner membrane protein
VGNHRRQPLAKTEIKSISFDDEEALAKLNEVIATLEELQQAYPGADIFLSGELTIDFPEDVKIPVEPNQMVTAELVGSSLKFSYCGLRNAMPFGLAKPIALLKEQYAVGTVEIKVVQPRPF